MPNGRTRNLVVVLVVAAVLTLFLDALLLAFAAVLFAVFLRSLAAALAGATGVRVGWSLAIVVVVLLGAGTLLVWYAAPEVGRQVDQLIDAAPQMAERASKWLAGYDWGRWLLARADGGAEWFTSAHTLRGASTYLGTGIGALTSLLVVLLAGLFMAAEPRPYLRGIVRLVPVAHRPRAATILVDVGRTLRAWILSKLVSMAVIFAVTWTGLALLGVPLALTLALLAALLTFIPNVGPILAAVPGVLLAIPLGTTTVLLTIALYVGSQLLETYLLAPLLERKTVQLPPAVSLFAQLALGAIAGGLGVVVATPLAAVALTVGRDLTDELDPQVDGRLAT